MKTILVPLDGSALALRILPYVRMLAPILGASVRLLRVITAEQINRALASHKAVLYELDAPQATGPAREPHVWELVSKLTQAYLLSQAALLRQDGFDVDIHVGTGSPAASIVEVAQATSATLIAMATHGYSGLQRWALGSVTDKVVQATTPPILIVPGVAPMLAGKLKRILLPLDGSEFAKQALPLATELATCANAELILFEAVPPKLEAYPGIPLPSDVLIALRDGALDELRALAGELHQYGLQVSTMVVTGHAAEKIIETAGLHQADLIVMATHGYGGLKRWALGSVADKVLHATTTPLLLVRAQAHPR